MPADATLVEHLLRDLAPQVLGAVARRNTDFSFAEDAVQEAMIAASSQWTENGIPDNPLGWLYHVATRRLTDHVRSEVSRRRREDVVATMYFADESVLSPGEAEPDSEGDEALILLFMCCHPALTPPSAIALTLRAVGGLTTAEIAKAFFVPEATMAQRVSRAKQTIKTSGIAFALPGAAQRSERLGAVLHVLYLIFNEGYASSEGPALQRVDLSNEAIRLARALMELMPAEREVEGLLALMLLTDARRRARSGSNGELVPLDEQDRSLWNDGMIAEGVSLVQSAMARGTPGSYVLQAAIAAAHAVARSVEDTDWEDILGLYTILESMSANPMVTLNKAIAVAMVHGPHEGLALLTSLQENPQLKGHFRLHAVRGHLLERAGDHGRAIDEFARAADRTMSVPERNYLNLKIARLNSLRVKVP